MKFTCWKEQLMFQDREMKGNLPEFYSPTHMPMKWNLNDEFEIIEEDGNKYKVYEVDKVKYWYLNNKLHRESGPAVICCNGTEKWYLNGKFVKEQWA